VSLFHPSTFTLLRISSFLHQTKSKDWYSICVGVGMKMAGFNSRRDVAILWISPHPERMQELVSCILPRPDKFSSRFINVAKVEMFCRSSSSPQLHKFRFYRKMGSFYHSGHIRLISHQQWRSPIASFGSVLSSF